MKWKIRLARDRGQEAFVVIEALTSEEAEAVLWHDMDPDVIRWSDDDVMGDREVREVCPADDKDELTPLEVPPIRMPKDLKTYRVAWVIEVEADTPLSAGETSSLLPDATGHGGLRSFRGLPVRRSALRTPGHDRSGPRSQPNP